MVDVIWSHAADDCSSHVTWTRMNWFKPESLKLALVIWPNVPMIDMLFLCCFSACCVENQCIFLFFLCRPQFTCHGITKTLKSFVMFIMRDQWHWSTLKHHWLFFFLHVHQHYTVIFCWFKECIFSFNVTPTLVIITVLSSCSCINIRLIFVCNTL